MRWFFRMAFECINLVFGQIHVHTKYALILPYDVLMHQFSFWTNTRSHQICVDSSVWCFNASIKFLDKYTFTRNMRWFLRMMIWCINLVFGQIHVHTKYALILPYGVWMHQFSFWTNTRSHKISVNSSTLRFDASIKVLDISINKNYNTIHRAMTRVQGQINFIAVWLHKTIAYIMLKWFDPNIHHASYWFSVW